MSACWPSAPSRSSPLEGRERVIDINLMSVVRILTVYLPGLLEQRSGHIVNTASTAGCSPMATTGFRTPRRNMPSSACPKRWPCTCGRGVGVSCFCPAGVMTNIMEQITFYGDPEPPRPGNFGIIEADAAGELVADAVADGRFLVLTTDEARDELRVSAATTSRPTSTASSRTTRDPCRVHRPREPGRRWRGGSSTAASHFLIWARRPESLEPFAGTAAVVRAHSRGAGVEQRRGGHLRRERPGRGGRRPARRRRARRNGAGQRHRHPRDHPSRDVPAHRRTRRRRRRRRHGARQRRRHRRRRREAPGDGRRRRARRGAGATGVGDLRRPGDPPRRCRQWADGQGAQQLPVHRAAHRRGRDVRPRRASASTGRRWARC